MAHNKKGLTTWGLMQFSAVQEDTKKNLYNFFLFSTNVKSLTGGD